MLTALTIGDIVLIDRLALDAKPGLTALTGETGAGKSILLDALGLALGARAEKRLVRAGAESGAVTAAFDPPLDHPVWSLLAESGVAVAPEDGGVILRRAQDAGGRARAFINDQPVTVGLMRDVGALLVEIQGQHADRALVQPAAHRALLDGFAGVAAERAAVEEAFEAWREAEDALARRVAEAEAAARELDYLQHVLNELNELQPKPGEEAALAEERAFLSAAEHIAGDLRDAASALGGDGTLEAGLARAARGLSRARERLSADAPAGGVLQAALDAVDRVLVEAGEARGAIANALEATQADPQRLEAAEERLFALRAAARKHDVAPDALSTLRERIAERLDLAEGGARDRAGLEREVEQKRDAYRDAAKRLSQGRIAAAPKLDRAVAGELAPLKLEKTVFRTEIETDFDNPSASGVDRVEFRVRTNPGAPEGPMAEIASGGEFARFILALKTATAGRGAANTLVFDEADRGVGGATAEAIGARLKRLSDQGQVFVVTHSPQVAALADAHWRIQKAVSRGETRTSVEVLEPDARLEEIARMLSGAEVTKEARAAAAQLLRRPTGAKGASAKPRSRRRASS